MNTRKTQLELARRCLDGEATSEEFAQLEELLRNDPEFRKDYLRYVSVDLALAAMPENGNLFSDRSYQDASQPSQIQNRGLRRFRGLAGWVSAAVAMLLLAGVLIYQVINSDRGETSPHMAGESVAELVGVNDSGVAVLTRVSGLKGKNATGWQVGETIPPGSMEWDAGLLQLEFYCGATVVVEGPAEIEIVDEAQLVCRSGRLRAHVPEPARGFAVLAPSFELVDLGTEFGLNVSENGAGEVHVFDGKVELYDPQSNRDRATRRELTAGDAMTVEHDGTSKPIAVRDADFVTPARLSQMAGARQQGQHRDWRAFRDSLQDDPRVVAYFPFDRNVPEDRLLVGYGASGATIEGAIVGCEWSEGRWPGKTSLQFKRPGDRVRITVPGEFKSLTYSTWVRVDGLDRTHNSLLLTDGFGRNGIHWQIRQNGNLVLGVRYSRNSARSYQSDSIFNPFRLGQWVHLATVFDAQQSRVKHYVNGGLAKRERLRMAATGILKIGNATIGNWSIPTPRHRDSSVRNFNGCMDELIVFSEALDEHEVRRIYEVGRP